jgi:thioredoxin reductase (NADPH)
LENYLGLYDLTGTEVAKMFRKHLEDREIHIFEEEIKEIKSTNNLFYISSDKEEYLAKTIILATGTRPRKLVIPGIENVLKMVHYGIDKDFSHYVGHNVLVVGGRNSGVVTAVRLKEIGANPIIIEKSKHSTAKERYLEKIKELSIPLLTNSSLERIVGEGVITEAHLIVNGESKIIEPTAIFGCIGYIPNNELAIKLGLNLDNEGYIEVDRKMQTSRKGIYAAGDVNGGVKMIAVASGEGAIAEYYVNTFVRSEWKEE